LRVAGTLASWRYCNHRPLILMSQFSLTTAQLARAAGVTAEVLHSHVKRNGHWKGHQPRKQPNGRHLWPRDALQACGLIPQQGTTTTVDVRAVLPWLEARALPADDAVTLAVAVALVNPRKATDRPPVAHVEDAAALADIVNAHVDRLESDKRLTGAQRHDAELALARALARASNSLPDDLKARAQRELYLVEA
jgi:hypothetical protein